MKNLYKKLHDLQKDLEPIKKKENNPFFKSKYFDINALIAAIQPYLTKHGLVIVQPLTHVDDKAAITTTIADVETGEAITETTILPETGDAQKMGGAITYLRRYSLQSLLLLEAEDDDGNLASSKSKPKEKTAMTVFETIESQIELLDEKQLKGALVKLTTSPNPQLSKDEVLKLIDQIEIKLGVKPF